MPASKRIGQFFDAVTVDPSVHCVASALTKKAETDPTLAKLFMAVQAELGEGQSLRDKQQAAMLDRIQTDDTLGDAPAITGRSTQVQV